MDEQLRLVELAEPMTGNDYRDRIARYVLANYERHGVEVYTEVKLGKTVMGKGRRIDVMLVRGDLALALECKFQASRGTTDEKIHYALADLDAMWGLPGCLVYAGEGWSPGALHTLAAARHASRCAPDAGLAPSTATLELDHVIAAAFGLWRAVLPAGRRLGAGAAADICACRYCCVVCGGENVQMVEWLYPNTERDGAAEVAVGDPFTDGQDPDLCWCDDCNEHVALHIGESSAG